MNPNQEGVLWLYLFLARTFFQECDRHVTFRNHQNKYCIDCDMAACQHCMAETTHDEHRPYASNGKQVLALHPLPHNNSGQLEPDRACRTCTRVLMNPNTYTYCSIACKLSIQPAVEDKGDAGSKPGAGAGGKGGGGGGAGKHSKRSNSRARARKGVSHRSPLF